MFPWRKAQFAWMIALVIGQWLAFGASVDTTTFVHDEHIVIEHNQQVTWPPSLSALATGRYFGDRKAYGYIAISRPLVTLSFCIEQGLGWSSPSARHTVQLCLDIACVLLVFSTLLAGLRASGQTPLRASNLAGSITLLWSLHPSHVEVVANLANRPEILSLCCLCIMALTLLAVRAGRGGWLPRATAAFFFGCALLAKESALGTLAPVLLMATWTPQGRQTLKKTALALLAVAGLWLAWRRWNIGTLLVNGIPFADNPLVAVDAPTRWLNAVAILARGLQHLVLLADPSPDYSFDAWPVIRGPSPAVALGLGALALASWFAYGWHRQMVNRLKLLTSKDVLPPLLLPGEGPLLALALALCTWLPVSHLLFPSTVVFADRLLFIPALALITLTVQGSQNWLDHWPSGRHRLVQVAALSLLGAVELAQDQTLVAPWSTDAQLYAYGTDAQPRSERMQYNHALSLYQAKDFAAARQHLGLALALAPEDPALIGLGFDLAAATDARHPQSCADAELWLKRLQHLSKPPLDARRSLIDWGFACHRFADAWPLARAMSRKAAVGPWPMRVFSLGIAAGDRDGATAWASTFVANPWRDPAWVAAAVFGAEQAGHVRQAFEMLADLAKQQPTLQGLDHAASELLRRHADASETLDLQREITSSFAATPSAVAP